MLKNLFSSECEEIFISNSKCFTGSQIPGKNIIRSLGLVSMVTKKVGGNIDKKFKTIVSDFVEKVEGMGGNAVINLRFEVGSYEQNGSQWMVTYVLTYGEAVVVK